MTKLKTQGLRGLQWFKRLMQNLASCGGLLKVKTSKPTAATYPQSNIIQFLKDLKLSVFIECIVDSNYSGLGTGSDTELAIAWMKLYSKYLSAKGDDRAFRMVTITAELEALRFRAQYIDFLISVMLIKYDKRIADAFKAEHENFEFTEQSYLIDMKHVQSIEKRNKLKYDALQRELQAMQRTDAGVAFTPTREYYIGLLLDINKHEGAHYDDSVNMEIFALCVKRLEAYYKHKKQEKDGSRAKG